MNQYILLDSSVLGLASNPNGSEEATACSLWLEGLLASGSTVIIPALADYEVRRELIRARKQEGLQSLDGFRKRFMFLEITQATMDLASDLWARARQQGKTLTDNLRLDGDAILMAQTLNLNVPADEVVVATTNVRHLKLFVNAQEWKNIT